MGPISVRLYHIKNLPLLMEASGWTWSCHCDCEVVHSSWHIYRNIQAGRRMQRESVKAEYLNTNSTLNIKHVKNVK